MNAHEIVTYAVVLMAALSIGWLFRRDSAEPAPVPNRGSDDAALLHALPGLLRMVYPVLTVLDRIGLGRMLTAPGSPKAEKLKRVIVTGGLQPLTPQTVACAQAVYALVFAGMMMLLALAVDRPQWLAPTAMLGVFLGWTLPSTAVEGVADRRRMELIRGLPFAIDLIGAAMRSGSSFGDAIRFYVTQGGANSLSAEFSRLMKQVQLGKSLPDALEEMARRVDSKEFTGFVSAVIHSLETGAALVDTLNIQGEEMRRVRFNMAEQKAARAPSIMILPIALFIMPSVFIVVFTPVYLKVQATGMGSMFAK